MLRSWTSAVLALLAGSVGAAHPVGDAQAQEASVILREIARCAEIENTIERGECYDTLAIRLEVAPRRERSQPAGRWRQSVDQSEFDDSKSVYLSVDADEEVQFGRFARVRPTLWVRCRENTTALIIDYGQFLGSGTIDVEYRIDRESKRSGRWGVSTNHYSTGLWRGGSSIPFIRRLLGKDRLLVRLTPHSENAVTVSFTVTGLENAIGELASACNWTP